MKKIIKTKLIPAILILVLPCAWLLSEIRWSRINNPSGRFDNLQEYLEHGRYSERVIRVEKNGNAFFITHSPMDTWLAAPSGPAAYVFDENGRLVDWSNDMGDDPSFRKRWPPPHENSSMEELLTGFKKQPAAYRR